MLCADYTAADGDKTKTVQFVFDGGILLDQIAAIQLPIED